MNRGDPLHTKHSSGMCSPQRTPLTLRQQPLQLVRSQHWSFPLNLKQDYTLIELYVAWGTLNLFNYLITAGIYH